MCGIVLIEFVSATESLAVAELMSHRGLMTAVINATMSNNCMQEHTLTEFRQRHTRGGRSDIKLTDERQGKRSQLQAT